MVHFPIKIWGMPFAQLQETLLPRQQVFSRLG